MCFGWLDLYECVCKEFFVEGIFLFKIYFDFLWLGVEDLLDMIILGVCFFFIYVGVFFVLEFYD